MAASDRAPAPAPAPAPPPALEEEEGVGEGARAALAALKVGAGAQGVKRPAPEASGGDGPAVGEGGAKRANQVGAVDGSTGPPSSLVFHLLVPAAAVADGGCLTGGSLEGAARTTGAQVTLLAAAEGCDERVVELSSEAEGTECGEPPAQARDSSAAPPPAPLG